MDHPSIAGYLILMCVCIQMTTVPVNLITYTSLHKCKDYRVLHASANNFSLAEAPSALLFKGGGGAMRAAAPMGLRIFLNKSLFLRINHYKFHYVHL